MQYQCVLPRDESSPGIRASLDRISTARQGSFLAVLKLLGPVGEEVLSFPKEGWTLALDFPMRTGTPAFLAALDEIATCMAGVSTSPRTPAVRQNGRVKVNLETPPSI